MRLTYCGLIYELDTQNYRAIQLGTVARYRGVRYLLNNSVRPVQITSSHIVARYRGAAYHLDQVVRTDKPAPSVLCYRGVQYLRV